jgi:hypothetical protein
MLPALLPALLLQIDATGGGIGVLVAIVAVIREGYLHRKKRPKKDREEKLFLGPSGAEAMQRRKQPNT